MERAPRPFHIVQIMRAARPHTRCAAPSVHSPALCDVAVRGPRSRGLGSYGFLSEKLELIDACIAAGITFVGPQRDAIRRMGSKIESKRLAQAAGVACVPGFHGDEQDDQRLAAEAAEFGWPLLIKASAGGGKGLKRVDNAAEFARQLAAARIEALAAFGDERVLLECCITRPRHLEVQLLGDHHGALVHLFERECSIQRQYQKVIEEAPAKHLSDTVRARLIEAAPHTGACDRLRLGRHGRIRARCRTR